MKYFQQANFLACLTFIGLLSGLLADEKGEEAKAQDPILIKLSQVTIPEVELDKATLNEAVAYVVFEI